MIQRIFFFEFSFDFKLSIRFQTADKENEQRRRLEQAAAQAAARKQTDVVVLRNNQLNSKKQQVMIFVWFALVIRTVSIFHSGSANN